ncbi:Cloroperoxidase [Dichomitus squalens LYAD-421 SS1]|uniref:Cloroperoxidase n=2 Tax=Dichomitus squalens TaxID=114155 RepID=A0A4Q9PTX6_9APHY|nr:Cloroperoxidase [Dichomitus squalens LYAD-421 SS1]EJF59901.1 Cloroperoxidase [Dichomitus squalens LYAD-421 SS1]TBU57926.1 Cloroperoxidase [Dichomitus squalens]
MTVDDSNAFIPATPDDSRSPCPALNALANHGYLPHDGCNLTASQLVSVLRAKYKISWILAALLSYGGVALCGHRDGWSWKLDLHELAKHDVIEHNGSLVHDDAAPGHPFAPTDVDRVLLRQLLSASSESDALTLHDLCRTQVQRQANSGPLSSVRASIAKGEVALLHQAFAVRRGTGQSATAEEGEPVVPKGRLEQWLGDERLPADWPGPEQGIGLTSIFGLVRKIGGMETKIKDKEKGSNGA